MKKLLLILLLVVMASAMALAQITPTAGTPTSSGTGGAAVPTMDVLGAHNNYGRGCAGCHAPHKGNGGTGGNAITGAVSTDPFSGDNALFAQDMGPLYGETFDFSDLSNTGSANKYTFTAPANGNYAAMSAQQYPDVRGIIMCLACHDGVVAKGAMMANHAYEQQIGALPNTYGTAAIPTLLGGEGTGGSTGYNSNGNYNNDHPVGDNASLDKALSAYNATTGAGYYGNPTNGINFSITAGNITSIAYAGQYNQFVTSYGAPALLKGAHSYPTPVNASGLPYLVCTTCHNQHVMNIYASSPTSPIATNTAGTYATYFFINGPYNVNDVTNHATAHSTTQFCRQCHFGESNEANGGTLATSF